MMSKTDKTRPYWVQIEDPYNRRFMMVGISRWSTDGTSEYHWKKMYSSKCWCCSQSKAHQFTERKRRTKWRKERQNLLKGKDYELYYKTIR